MGLKDKTKLFISTKTNNIIAYSGLLKKKQKNIFFALFSRLLRSSRTMLLIFNVR
jgi:hypothetical protein